MKATMSGASFNRVISAVKAFASKNEARPVNCLIQLHFCKDNVNVAAYAVDGYRAAKETSVCYTVDEDFAVLISAPPLKANGMAIVEIEREGEYAYISYGDVRFRNKQIDGEPFDVKDIIEKEMAKEGRQKIGFNVDYLLDAVKSIKASGTAFRKAVIIEFGGPVDPIIMRTDHDNPKMLLPVRLKADQ